MSDRHPFIPCAACGKGTGVHSVPLSHLIFCDNVCREKYVTRSIEFAKRSESERHRFESMLCHALDADAAFLGRLSESIQIALRDSGLLAPFYARAQRHASVAGDVASRPRHVPVSGSRRGSSRHSAEVITLPLAA